MKNTKYVMSSGLAFGETKDMEKLRAYSLNGWHLKKFAFMGYILEKGESEDYIYNVDYSHINKEDEEEYLAFFSSAGWIHVTSEGSFHLFRAQSGTTPIYTDNETKKEKYHVLSHTMAMTILPLPLLTIIAWFGAIMSEGILSLILTSAAILITTITLPLIWTTLVTYRNKWEVAGKKTAVRFINVVPVFICILTVILLIQVATVSDNVLKPVLYAVAGAIIGPIIMLGMLKFYYRMRQNTTKI